MVAVLANPGVKEQMGKQGFIPSSSTPEALTAYMKEQLAVWKTALNAAGLEPQ
jgi:tripartite-type tricarboxylate transporter receptor subunit TctC